MRKPGTISILLSMLVVSVSATWIKYGSDKGFTPDPSNTLFDTIAHMDSVLFTAFNNRDLKKIETLFTKDLEFYHDKGGLTNYDQNMENFKQLIDLGNDLRRELVKSSLEVYPVKGYGAIQTGSHTFCHTENGKDDCGTFKFLHIWKKERGEWKISRVVSYDH